MGKKKIGVKKSVGKKIEGRKKGVKKWGKKWNSLKRSGGEKKKWG